MPLSTPTNRPSDLLELASLCRVSYMGGSQAKTYLKHGYQGGVWFKAVENAFCLVVDDGTHRIIAFRGSDDSRDWLGNFRYGRHSVAQNVHEGFWEHADLLWPFVHEQVLTADRQLFLAGHSLGGAAAVVSAYRFMRNADAGRIAGVVTFGSPRVGSPQLALELQQAVKVTRVVNEGDWVDNLPPRFGRIKFEHCGELVHLSRNGRIGTEIPTIRRQAWGYAKQWLSWGEPLDHSIDEYCRRLKDGLGVAA